VSRYGYIFSVVHIRPTNQWSNYTKITKGAQVKRKSNPSSLTSLPSSTPLPRDRKGKGDNRLSCKLQRCDVYSCVVLHDADN